jgi:flagellar basal body-associated protein FliL
MSGQWYYSEDGAQYGPVDEAEIVRLIQDGELPTGTPVLQEGSTDWEPARNHACFQVEIYPKKKRPPVQATASTASKPASGGTSQLPSQTAAQPAVIPASPAVTTVVVKEKSALPWVVAGFACVGAVVVTYFAQQRMVDGIKQAIQDSNGPIAMNMTEGAGGHGSDASHGADDGHGAESAGGVNKTETKAGTPVPIVGEGDFIVVNPAGSTRYLMVEILLIRKEAGDNGFPGVVKENRKLLQAKVINVLSAMSAEELAEPSIRNRMPNQLKGLFQSILGTSHPIESVIISKWVMQ